MVRIIMGTVNLERLKDYMTKHVEETQMLELLDLTTEDLVEAFSDRIEERYAYIVQQLEIDGGHRRDPLDFDRSDNS